MKEKESFEEFRTEASELQEKVRKYQSTFNTFNDLFSKDLLRLGKGTIQGKICLSGTQQRPRDIEITVVVRKLDLKIPQSDLTVDIGVEIGLNNLAKIECFKLTHPNRVSVEQMDKINENPVLEIIVDEIKMRRETRDGFVAEAEQTT